MCISERNTFKEYPTVIVIGYLQKNRLAHISTYPYHNNCPYVLGNSWHWYWFFLLWDGVFSVFYIELDFGSGNAPYFLSLHFSPQGLLPHLCKGQYHKLCIHVPTLRLLAGFLPQEISLQTFGVVSYKASRRAIRTVRMSLALHCPRSMKSGPAMCWDQAAIFKKITTNKSEVIAAISVSQRNGLKIKIKIFRIVYDKRLKDSIWKY